MPDALLKGCRFPFCTELVERGFCARHQREQTAARPTTTERLYGWRWQQRRLRFLEQFPYCGLRPQGQPAVGSRCQREGRVTKGHAVDHVTPHRGDLGLFWDEQGNWQTLCEACHNAKSATER